MSPGGDRRMRGQAGIVGLNLALTIAFALFAVIELSRVTLAAKQIDDRVEQITTDVGPGSNVSQLTETAKLNDVAQKAEDILKAAKPLSGQAQAIIDTAKSIDNTASSILTNADAINGTAQGINSSLVALQPVVNAIHGSGGKGGGGVEAINIRASEAFGPVAGIADDLNVVNGNTTAVRASANGICHAVLLLSATGCTP